jgi:hypothetical protein
MFKGMNGLQGPPYGGTGCFHRRKALYEVPPATDQFNNKGVGEFRNHVKGKASRLVSLLVSALLPGQVILY